MIINEWPSRLAEELQDKNRTHILGDVFYKAAYKSAFDESFVATTDEMWRYTDPELFNFKKFLEVTKVDFNFKNFITQTPFAVKDSTLIRGVVVSQNSSLTEADLELAKDLLNDKSVKGRKLDDAVSKLYNLLVDSIVVIRVAKNVQLKDTLELKFNIDEKKSDNSIVPLVIIVADEGAKISIIERLNDTKVKGVFSRVEIICGKNAIVNYSTIEELSEGSQMISRQRIHAERDTSGEISNVFCGKGNVRVDLDAKMLGEGCSWDLLGVSVCDKKRNVNFYPTQEHIAGNCRSDLFCKNVAKDSSRAVYYGYVRVSENAQKTDAYQTNRNLILSKNARIDSIPNLEIKANDVKCSHGSSTGEVNADELFYLQARGLTKEESENLLVEGFLNDIVYRFKDEDIRNAVQQIAIDRFNEEV